MTDHPLPSDEMPDLPDASPPSVSQTNQSGHNFNIPGAGTTAAGGNIDQSQTITAQTVNQYFQAITNTDSSRAEVVRATWHASPFPGLRAFTPSDADLFYGRETEIKQLLNKVAQQRFVIVQGASGSGKSSLVGAGLIPRLRRPIDQDHPLPNSANWLLPDWGSDHTQRPTLYCTPAGANWLSGHDPFVALTECLFSVLPKSKKPSSKGPSLANILRSSPQALTETLMKALDGLPANTEALLFVDQFEELFSIVDEQWIEPFIASLDHAAQHEQVRIIATLRTDFIDPCLKYPQLVIRLNEGTYYIGSPSPDDLLDMVTQPAG